MKPFLWLLYRKYPEISSVDHLWVSRVWIKDLGLNQYSSAFESQMIDGRLLNVLTKKDMEKYLNVNKKFHQVMDFVISLGFKVFLFYTPLIPQEIPV